MPKFMIIAILVCSWFINANVFAAHSIPPSIKPEVPVNEDLMMATEIGVSAVLVPGSLRSNILTLAQQFGWDQVIWNVSEDYQWTGCVSVSAPSFKGILEQVLADYPLQAIFYHGNHVLVIAPRSQ